MKFLERILLPLLLLSVCLQAGASFPLVKNFPRGQHSGGAQTWSVARDEYGCMYFGNNSGLLTFDSSSWNLYGVANGSTVRSVLVSYAGGERRLYVGASEEIGYFYTDTLTGNTAYREISNLLPISALPFKEIWNIFATDKQGELWFQADYHLFRYENDMFSVIPVEQKITASAFIDGKIYVATSPGGVGVLRDKAVVPLAGNERLAGCRICAILPYYGRVMVVTEYDGLFAYDGVEITPIKTDFDDFMKRSQVFCATCHENTYAFGTVSKGVVVTNFITGRTSFASKDTGLQNNTVLSAYFDRDGNLWLGLDNGIDLLYVNSPYYSLLGDNSGYGAGYKSKKIGNRLYLGTNQGLFALDSESEKTSEPPVLTPLLKGQVWDIADVEGDVFVCSDAGVSYGRGGSFRYVGGLPGSWCVLGVPGYEGYALASTYDTFHLLCRQGDRWADLGVVDGYHDRGGRFVIDSDGYVWIAHWLKGVYRLALNVAGRRFSEVRFYDSSLGFPTNRNIGVTLVGGRTVFMAEGGFFRLTPDGTSIMSDSALTALLGSPPAPRLYTSPAGALWSITDKAVTVASPRAVGDAVVDSVTYSPMAEKLIPGFVDLDFVSDSRLIVSMQNGFFDVDLNASTSPAKAQPVYFRRMVSYGDSARVTAPVFLPEREIFIPYALNSQRFEVVAPEYRADNAVTYSFYLENYDSGWSDYTTSAFKEYTKLPEGKYAMNVRAYNSYTRTTDERTLHFTILPPWYRTTTAKLIYSALALVLLYLLFKAVQKLSLRSSRKIAERKQQELDMMARKAREESLLKDYEIADLKGRQLEQDIHFKTRELSNITMNVVRKNEILQEISDRLDSLARLNDPSEISRHIGQLRALIRENISHDDDWRTFMHNFDAAYGDFTKRLQQRHDGLTPTELRVCCYLIMGLNSKEMARVFNISHRSVEMTRYRLRKKLDLTRDTNLTDYLQSIFNNTDSGPEA